MGRKTHERAIDHDAAFLFGGGHDFVPVVFRPRLVRRRQQGGAGRQSKQRGAARDLRAPDLVVAG